jgi:hypothetical protein
MTWSVGISNIASVFILVAEPTAAACPGLATASLKTGMPADGRRADLG